MTGSKRSGTRWIAPLLAGALVASAVVGYALVRMTSPADDGSGGQASTAVTSLTEDLMSSPTSLTGGVSSTSDNGSAEPDTTAGTGGPTQTADPEPTVPEAITSELPGSETMVPAAWSGTATVTVTVLGDCAAAPSVYTDVPADVALDLVGNEANAAETPLDPGIDPASATLTLGINPGAMPSLAVYSSQISEDGVLHRYWDLRLSAGANWTEISGTLIQQPSEGPNPNMMVDSESSLQSCEAAGTVSLPRALAAGSTITGWVTRTRANLTLHAVTTDGKRAVEVQIDAQRKQ